MLSIFTFSCFPSFNMWFGCVFWFQPICWCKLIFFWVQLIDEEYLIFSVVDICVHVNYVWWRVFFFFFFQDSELNELRATIEALKRQSGLSIPDPTILSPGAGRRHTSPGMVNTNDYISSPLHSIHQQSPHHGNRPGFNTLPMPTGKSTILA